MLTTRFVKFFMGCEKICEVNQKPYISILFKKKAENFWEVHLSIIQTDKQHYRSEPKHLILG